MKVFLFAPVLRKGSFNKKLIRIAHKYVATLSGVEADLHEFNEFPMPVYDGDLEVNEGIPDGVQKLAKKVQEADAIIISSPEYNSSIPGPFKNAIDWLSRLKPVPLDGKQILLLGASSGHFAAMNGQYANRVPLQKLKAFVYPEYFGVAYSEKAFDEQGNLKDEKELKRLQGIIGNFLHYASREETPFDRLEEFFDEQKNQGQNPHPSH